MVPDRAKNIGVFGAKGFIGRHLVRRLASLGRPVVAFGRNFPANYTETIGHPVEVREIDFHDVIGTQAKIQDISIVVQLINSSSPSLGNSHVSADFKSNVAPHIHFIESCIASKVETFLFLSSGGTVYGNPNYLPINEDHPTFPISSYGLTKLIIEHYIRLLTQQSNMGYVNLRVSNPYGPGQSVNKGQGLIASILQRRMQGNPIIIYGDGSIKRDYLYIDDVIDALISAMDTKGLKTTLNIGSGIGRSVLDVVAALENILGEKIRTSFVEGRSTDARSNILDASRAREIISWYAYTDFFDGLQRTVESSDS